MKNILILAALGLALAGCQTAVSMKSPSGTSSRITGQNPENVAVLAEAQRRQCGYAIEDKAALDGILNGMRQKYGDTFVEARINTVRGNYVRSSERIGRKVCN